MIDRYHYDLGGVQVGPRPGIIAFTPEWQGNHPPQHPIAIASLKGCDVTPVDLTDPAQALRLKAYIWPEHPVRFARLEAAIAAAKADPPEDRKEAVEGKVGAEQVYICGPRIIKTKT